jgi:hypothetical protein
MSNKKVHFLPYFEEAAWDEARYQQALVEGWSFEEQPDGLWEIIFPIEVENIWYAVSLPNALAAIRLLHEPDEQEEEELD